MSEQPATADHGLPEALPAGEVIVWQGAPAWGAVARRVLHVRKVALYFALLLAWSVASGLYDGLPGGDIARDALTLLPVGGAAIGLLLLFAWLIARTTRYTITTRRVVMQFGVALSMSVNFPFRIIEAASLRRYTDGTGDIPLTLSGDGRLAYLVLWPHARPWQIRRPQPMLRVVPRAAEVAETLARAMTDASDRDATAPAASFTATTAAVA